MTHTSQNPSGRWQTIKRTFWFGTLGALAALPFPLGFILDSWFDTALNNQFLISKRDAAFYHYLDMIFPGGYPQAALSVKALVWGLAVLLAFRLGFLTRARLRFWDASSEYSKRHAGGTKEMLAKLLLAALFLGASLGSGLDLFFYYPPESVTHMHSAFGGPAGPVVVYLFPLVQMATFGFLVAATIYAVVTSVSFMDFLVKAIVGGVVMAAGIATLSVTGAYLDLNRYLGDLPGVSAEPEPRTLVVLSTPPIVLPIYMKYRDCPSSGKFCKGVYASDNNAEAAGEYMKSKGYATALRGTGFGLMATNRLAALDPEGALTLYRQGLDITGDKTQGLSLMSRLVYSPTTPAYRAVLDDIANSGRYQVNGRNALRLSKAYARYGELDTARKWYQAGVDSAGMITSRDAKYFKLPKKPPFRQGSIGGIVTVDGVPAEGIRVGIVTVAACRNMLFHRHGMKKRLVPFYDMQGITDGTATGKDGRFRFDGLGEDSYVLLLSLKDPQKGAYRLQGPPGVLVLTVREPRMDAGEIKLATK